MEPVRGGSFIVFHDAYQYFEDAFDFPAAGAISIADASDPSPARIAEIQSRIREEGINCVLAEPQFNPGIVKTVLDGTEAKTGVIDPLGSELEPGADLYPQVILNMARHLGRVSLALLQARFSLRNWPGSSFQETGRINSATEKIGNLFMLNGNVRETGHCRLSDQACCNQTNLQEHVAITNALAGSPRKLIGLAP